MVQFTRNNTTYDTDDLTANDGRGYADVVTAGTGDSAPRYIAMMIDHSADIGLGPTTTSTTSLSIGTGSKAFTLATDVAFAVGGFVIAAETAAPTTNYMIGQVTAKSGTSLTINVPDANHYAGSGTIAAWTLSVTGAIGPTGATGAGDVNGPGSSVNNTIAIADGTTGKVIKYTGITVDSNDVMDFGANNGKIDDVIIKTYREELYTNASATGTVDLDLSLYNTFKLTLTGNTTLTISNADSGAHSFTLEVIQDGTGGRTLTVPASVDWAGGTAPTLVTTNGSVSILTFYSSDSGTIWHGMLASGDSK